jgi:amino acid adenylation domain-containing protein
LHVIYLLTQIIEVAAEQAPDKDAFRFRDEALTYTELVARANRLANTLCQHGAVKGDRVGIFLPKCLETAVAVYGIMQAGCAYVPLDPKMPAARLALIIQDCGIRHIVAGPDQIASLRQLPETTPLEFVVGPDAGAALPFTVIPWSQVDQAPAHAPAVRLMEEDMAYLMYTSGSTGEPKGMVHTHHSGLSYARLAADVYGLHGADRLSDFPPLHFDQSTFGLFSGPLAMATTVVIPEEYMLLPASLSQLMADERITVWYSVPFALIQLHLRGALAQREMSALRWVLFGGEPFPLKHLRALMAQWPQARFSNVYGPAEVNQCTYYHVPPLGTDEESIPIGRIWPNAEGLIVDEEDRPVGSGEPGELLVRTPTMMQGYWRRPDLNDRAFYRLTQESGQSQIFYRTGDLVQLRPDGELLFLGRIDRQVKVRGFRIELDEIEAALLAHSAVEEAAAFTVENGDGVKEIHVAVIVKDGHTLAQSALLADLAERLPRYALPQRIEFWPNFPRTTSGKIDRKQLRRIATAPEAAAPEAAAL